MGVDVLLKNLSFSFLSVGLQSKPTTGLGRCRAVGLSRPRKNSKDSAKKTNNTVAPLLSYFTYRGRDRTSQEVTEQTGV